MTEKQSSLQITRPAEQATTAPPQFDGPTANPPQKPTAASSTPEPLAFDASESSRIEPSPWLRKALTCGQLSRLKLLDFEQTPPPNRAATPAARKARLARETQEARDTRDSNGAATPSNAPLSLPGAAPEADSGLELGKPKTWLGVVITCLLGALPIIVLVLVRWQGHGSEVPAPPMEAMGSPAAPTQVMAVSAPASLASQPTRIEAEPEVVDAPLEHATPPPADRWLASKPTPVAQRAVRVAPLTPSLTSPPNARPCPAPCNPAPVRSSWFHR